MTAFLIIAALILLNGIFVAAEFAIVGAPASGDRPQGAATATGSRGSFSACSTIRGSRIGTSRPRSSASPSRASAWACMASTCWPTGSTRLLGAPGLPSWLASHGLASTIAVVILTYFHIVIGEMVPKSLALQHAEQMALWITPPMLWIRNALFPFVLALNGLGNQVLKLLGVNRQAQNADRYYTSEELQLIVQESEDLGAIRAESGQMLQELFEFGDLTAGEAMVPRVRVVGIPLGTPPDQIRELLGRTPHTRYPVYERRSGSHHRHGPHQGSAACAAARRGDPAEPRAAPAARSRDRAARFGAVDDAAGADADGDRARRARGHLRRRHARGPVRGGRRRNRGRARQRHRRCIATPSGRLRVPGTMRLDELGQEFDLDLEHEDVDSVSGLVLTLLGRPPAVGDTCATSACSWK